MKKQFILKNDDGTYYLGMCQVGPRFGGSREEAQRFDSREELAREMGKHWAVTGEVEEY